MHNSKIVLNTILYRSWNVDAAYSNIGRIALIKVGYALMKVDDSYMNTIIPLASTL